MRYGCQKKGTGKAVLKAATGVMALAGPMLQNSPLSIQARQFQQGVPVSKKRVNIPVYKEIKKEKKTTSLKEGGMPSRNKKNFRSTKSGAGMTQAGVMSYRRKNPGSKLQTAVTGKVKSGSKDAKRRKSYCARSLGQLKRSSAKTRNDPNSRIRQARRRWKC